MTHGTDNPLAEEAIFNMLFSDKGSYIDTNKGPRLDAWDDDIVLFNRLLGDLSTCVKEITSAYSSIPDIKIGLIDAPLVGASVNRYKGSYYIAMYKGTYIILQSMFARILTLNNSFVNYGKAHEEEPSKLYNPHIRNIEQLRLQDVYLPDIKDIDRAELSVFLTFLAMRYLILHETGHILNGHLDLKCKITSSMNWTDLLSNSSDTNSLSPIHSQVLEYDADAFAANASLRYVMQIFYEQTPESEAFLKYYRNEYFVNKFSNYKFEQIVFLHTFACLCTFRLFTDLPVSQEKLSKLKYCPPIIRMLQYFTHTVEQLLSHIQNVSDDHRRSIETGPTSALDDNAAIINITAAAGRELDEAFVNMSEKEGIEETGLANLPFAYGQKEHLGILDAQWNEVRELLLPFAHIPIAPAW
jgi:hypothetical protein